MNLWDGLRLVAVALVGACAGSLVNWAVYALAWNTRPISPWQPSPAGAPPRRGLDRLPIVGWLGLRREAALHGRAFWLRPMAVELGAAVGLAWFYWFEVLEQGLLPVNFLRPLAPQLSATLHALFLAHAVLAMLMLAASLIDLDEKTIPDGITIPGTLFGLLVAIAFPRVLLPVVYPQPGAGEAIGVLTLAAPWPSPANPPTWIPPHWLLPDQLSGFPQGLSLALALGCWWLWCVGLMHRTWYSRHGWRRALQLALARLARQRSTVQMLALGLIGTATLGAVWFGGGDRWAALLTALAGMAAGGALIWVVRIVAGLTLHREAMGFGDVTLMAMLGTLLGWQTCLMVFFAAPLVALVVGILTFILHRENEIPYGPYLCLAASAIVLAWRTVWPWAEHNVFFLGPWLPVVLAVCAALMPPLLLAIVLTRRLLSLAASLVRRPSAGE